MCHCNTSIAGGRAMGTDRACWLPDELESENSFRERPFLKGIMQSVIDEHNVLWTSCLGTGTGTSPCHLHLHHTHILHSHILGCGGGWKIRHYHTKSSSKY